MILAWKSTPLSQSQLFLKEKVCYDLLRGVLFYAKIVYVQELWLYKAIDYVILKNHRMDALTTVKNGNILQMCEHSFLPAAERLVMC